MTKANFIATGGIGPLVQSCLALLAFAAALSPAALPATTGTKSTGTQTTGTTSSRAKAAGTKAAKHPSKPKAMPTFEAVKATITGQLAKNRSYKPGDVLSRKEVEPIFDKLAKLGWKVSDRKVILDLLLPDNYYLVRALRSADNSLFMRQVGQVPDGYGYDRLDRVSRMDDGEVLVSRIMQSPGGWNFVDLMSETIQAPGMAFSFSMGPGGKDFMKPTGRIYTEQQLIARLKESYDKATAKTTTAEKPATKGPATSKPSTKKP
jgi:hypothetical protein